MLEWTGERYVSQAPGVHIHYEHLHRYALATQIVKGKTVLDLACGEGYGAFMLARQAKSVIGIDIDENTIHHAICKYRAGNLIFITGSMINNPIDSYQFDVIVCFEAIEHIQEHGQLMSEVKRLLKANGMFIVSSPNKSTYTDDPHYQNPFHRKELYLDDFKELLGKHFRYVHFLGQRVYSGSHVWSLVTDGLSKYEEFVIQKDTEGFVFNGAGGKSPLYYIAIASDEQLEPYIANLDSWLVDTSDSLQKDYQKQIAEMAGCMNDSLKIINVQNDKLLSLISAIKDKESQINQLQVHLQAIENSRGMRLIRKYHAIKNLFYRKNLKSACPKN